MTRADAMQTIERLGIDLFYASTDPIEETISLIRDVDYGDGRPTETELTQLRRALQTIQRS